LKISTKVEFGIMAIIDIAVYSQNGCSVTAPDIAKRHNISKKYLEQILPSLTSANLIRGQKGLNGGYVVARDLSKITFKDILNALDTRVLNDVYFDSRDKNDMMTELINDRLWSAMSSYLQNYAESITLAEIAEHYKQNEIIAQAEAV
jgi:Rrf2 family protein